MASIIKVNKISPYSGTDVTLGNSGDSFSIPAGAAITNSGTATGFGGGKVVKVSSVTDATRTAVSASGATRLEIAGLELTHTAASTSNRLLFMAQITGAEAATSWYADFWNKTTSAFPVGAVADAAGSRNRVTSKQGSNSTSWGNTIPMIAWITPPDTNANTYVVRMGTHSGTGKYNSNGNAADSSSADDSTQQSSFTIMEIDSTIV